MDDNRNYVLQTLLSFDKQPDWISAKLILNEAYDLSTGVFDHIEQSYKELNNPEDLSIKRPLALVAFHESEDLFNNSRFDETIRAYKDHEIMKHFGLSLLDFFDLPHYIAQHLLRVCNESIRSENQRTDDILKDMKVNR